MWLTSQQKVSLRGRGLLPLLLAASVFAGSGGITCRADVSNVANAEDLPGAWRYVKDGFFASGTVVTWLNKDASCEQVIRASVLGSEHWKWLACRWRLHNDQLELTVVDSDSETAPAGKVLTFMLHDVGNDALHYGEDGELTEWRRIESVPEAFAAHRDTARAAAGASHTEQ